MSDYEVLKTQAVYQGHVFDVRVDLVQLPGGKKHSFDVVEHRQAVTILPIDEEGLVWFVRQYRHPVGKTLLELPAGVCEVDEEPLVSAQRELREEIGMDAKNFKLVGQFYLAPGYSTEYMHIFVATGLIHSPLPGDEDESLHIEKIPFSQLMLLIKNGVVQDSKSLAAILLAQADK